jgi:signal transduction histidine kinase
LQKYASFKQFFIRNSYLLVIAAWLITISFIIDNYLTGNASPKTVAKNLSRFIAEQQNDFASIASDTAVLNHLVSQHYDESLLQQLSSKKYYLFVYQTKNYGNHSNLLFWSTQVVDPSLALASMNLQTGFIQLSNGYYVWQKSSFKDITLLGLIPIMWNYAITNDYLTNSFTTGKDIEKAYSISDKKLIHTVYSVDGHFLFSLSPKALSSVVHNNLLAFILRMIAVVFILFFIQLTAVYLIQKNFYKGGLFLTLLIIGLRVASYYLPIPVNFRQFELFDPAIYGSNSISRSLGDLLINSILFLWVILFIRFYIQDKKVTLLIKSAFIKWWVILFGATILLLCTILVGHVFRSMVADSNISFDVVNFYTLSVYSVIGFIVFGCLAIGYFLVTQIVIYLLQPLLPKNILLLLMVITVIGLLVLSFRVSNPNVLFELYLLIWLLVYLLLLNNQYLFLLTSAIISSRFIFWLFFFSISISSVILIENGNKEMGQRKHYAEILAIKADPSSERLMNTVLTDFSSDALAPVFDSFKMAESNKSLKGSLLNDNFTGYLNKYDTKIFTFDANEKSLFNEDSASFNILNTILNTQAKPTAIPGLYFYDVSYDRFNYISKKEIIDATRKLLGYVFILASPKKYKTDALYPELFLKGYENSIENSPVYFYAVYNQLRLVSSHNEYAFPLQLASNNSRPATFRSVKHSGYDELWYKSGAGKAVVIVKKDNFFIETITLFSYLFCTFLFITAISWILTALIQSRLHLRELGRYWQMSIRNQIHSTVIFISLSAFIIVGVATIIFFIDQYNNNNREQLGTTIHIMQNEVRNALSDMIFLDDVTKVYDDQYLNRLKKLISKISEAHAVDINFYDLDGALRASSLPLPYSKGIVSSKMDPLAYYHLHHLKEIQFFKEETIGSLQFLSNYVPIMDESGSVYAYLNTPYFTSQSKLRQEISNFLVAIINLNAFIFLIAGVVAFFITNRITRSFSFISNKMKAISLGQMNETIIWNRKDEIGDLVAEYNKMVAKLDDSAVALAKNERESAWREMARQVAHEIKNPLTPMKLSLQHLQRAIEMGKGDIQELTKSVSRTLVEQIDHLSQIAADFSQFANIGNPHKEVFDLNEMIQLLTQLHFIEGDLDLTWKPEDVKVLITADRTHINRLFTNLIQNALQSIPEGSSASIIVAEKLHNKNVLITVSDNGVGIPEDIRSKIFTPNFTTKNSGTGLGLAMCKGIVEECKGNIWFETVLGKGTTFFVELPLTIL